MFSKSKEACWWVKRLTIRPDNFSFILRTEIMVKCDPTSQFHSDLLTMLASFDARLESFGKIHSQLRKLSENLALGKLVSSILLVSRVTALTSLDDGL